MSERLFIVTGASRGLGAAMARHLLQPGHSLICLSRQADAELAALAEAASVELEQWQVDLADPLPVAARLEGWLDALPRERYAAASLINNAGVLTRIGALERCTAEELSSALRVGLEAPLLLTAAFLRATSAWPGERRVLNISSGLGRRAMAGQATYCTAKAGMDHLSRAVALDQAELASGARIVSLAPGIIDTDMQVQLRGADGSGFPEHAMFVGFKEEGRLASADATAAAVLRYLSRADFGATPLADIRDA